MWSLPLCLSSPLDSGTALSIIKWHTAIASVIDDPRTHTCFHFDDVRTFFFFWRLSLFLLSLQILRRADKNGECCVFRRERNSGLRHYSSLSVCLSVCLSLSLSLACGNRCSFSMKFWSWLSAGTLSVAMETGNWPCPLRSRGSDTEQ